MSYEDLIYSCRTLIALHDVYDEFDNGKVQRCNKDNDIKWEVKQ